MAKRLENFLTVTNSVLSPGFLGVMAGLAVTAAIFAPFVLTLVIAGAAFGIVSSIVSGVVKSMRNGMRERAFTASSGKDGRQQRAQVKTRSEAVGQDRVVDRDIVYDRRRGMWNISALPIDMKPTATSYGDYSLKGRVKKFDIGGIRGVVEGRAKSNGLTEFSFVLGDEKSAVKLSDIIMNSDDRHLSTASIRHSPDGRGYVCTCADPEGISLLFRKAEFSPKDVRVETKLHSVNQYEVKGCRTAEEARERFEQMKAECRLSDLRLVNSYEHVSTSMDGRQLSSSMNGKPYETKQMEIGSFIINDVYVATTAYKSTVMGGEMMDREHLASSVLTDPEAVSERLDAVCEASVDGMCLDCSRTVSLSDGKSMSVDRMDALAAKTAREFEDFDSRHYLKFKVSGPDELKAVLAGGVVPSDSVLTLVSNGRGSQNEEPGTFCIPVEGDMFDRLCPVLSEGDAARLGDYAGFGLSEDTLRSAVIGDRLSRHGECSVRFSETLGLYNSRIMGVGGHELAERLSDPNAYEFKTLEHMQLWAKEASRIEDVSVNVDYSRSELTIRSTVSNGLSSSTKVETRSLSAEELESVSRRLPLSSSAGKDLLMQCHPEYFKTYRGSDGRSMFSDPVKDFIDGRRPETHLERSERQRQGRKLGVLAGMHPEGKKRSSDVKPAAKPAGALKMK